LRRLSRLLKTAMIRHRFATSSRAVQPIMGAVRYGSRASMPQKLIP
jgi:hypothetical protein